MYPGAAKPIRVRSGNRVGGGINIRPSVVSPFDETLSRTLHPVTGVSDPAFTDRLSDIRGQLSNQKPLEHMSPSEVLQYRRNLGKRINFKTDPIGENAIPVMRKAYGGVSRTLHNEVPEIAPIDRSLHGLNEARDSLAAYARNKPVAESWIPNLTDLPAEEVGRALGGGPAAVTAMAGGRIARSMPFRTAIANGLYRGGGLIRGGVLPTSGAAAYTPFAAYLLRRDRDHLTDEQQ